MKKITTIKQLNRAINEGKHDFYILFEGKLRSSKYIDRIGEKYFILNLIDDTSAKLSVERLFDPQYTNIGTAMNKGMFYQE